MKQDLINPASSNPTSSPAALGAFDEATDQPSTPRACVQEMERLAAHLTAIDKDTIESCVVDDWGAYRNFSLRIVPAVTDAATKMRLEKLVTGALKALGIEAHLRKIVTPTALEKRLATNGKVAWICEVDYMLFDPQLRAFSETIHPPN